MRPFGDDDRRRSGRMGRLAAGRWTRTRALPFTMAALVLAFGAVAGPARAQVETLHAWGLAVDAAGTVYAADGRQEPGRVWRIDPSAFEHAGDEPGGDSGGGPGDGSTRGAITLALEAPGVRDLQLTSEGVLYVSTARTVAEETVLGDSVSVSQNGLLRLDLRAPANARRSANASASAELFVEWTSVDSLFSGPCFRVDGAGGVYFFWQGRLRYRDPDGIVTTFLGSDYRGERDGGVDMGRFNSVRAMGWAGNGDLFLVDAARVRRVPIPDRTVEGFASGLIERGFMRPVDDEEADPRDANRIYGVAANDDGERVWVAYYGGHKVISARRSGRSGTYYEPADSGWGPVGVVWTEDAIYVLEVHGRVTRDLRVTRIGASGEAQVVLPRRP